MLLLIGVWVFFMRQMQAGGGRAMGFGKSRARMLTEKQGRVTFDDVAGIDEAKAELQEIVEFLKDPQKFQRLGGKIPKGVLLVGPPGTGKTLLARAIAGEANVPFFTISGSDFVEMFVGVGASRVRDMFEQGKKNAPCIIFIDEIDAVGRHRGAGLGGGNDEREQTLNQMLVEMDGFEANEGVILIAATNRPDVLDPGAAAPRPLRPPGRGAEPGRGRAREDPAGAHAQGAAGVRRRSEASSRAARRASPAPISPTWSTRRRCWRRALGKRVVAMAEFEAAKDKVMMGTERRSLVMTRGGEADDRLSRGRPRAVRMHEPECDPVHKATIIPRGRALGVVMSLPEGDRYCQSQVEARGELTMAMGGRAAEEIIFGPDKVSNGAAGDIKMATDSGAADDHRVGHERQARHDAYGDNSQEVFLGHSVTQSKNVSEATARRSTTRSGDRRRGRAKAREHILTENIEELHRLARGLLEHETLSATRSARCCAARKSCATPADPTEKPNRHAGPALVRAASPARPRAASNRSRNRARDRPDYSSLP